MSDFYVPSTPAQPMYYRQGVIQTWNPADATNTVLIDGTVFTNLAILNTDEALLLSPGAVVGVVDVGSTWAILGRFTVPGTTDAASSLAALGTFSNTVATFETYSSSTLGDLATPGPTVTVNVPKSGRMLIMLSARIGWSNQVNGGGLISLDVSGANTIAVGNAPQLAHSILLGSSIQSTSILRTATTYVYNGLNPGSTTWTMKYGAPNSTQCDFQDRTIVLIPL